MRSEQAEGPERPGQRFIITLARHDDEVREAQRLRHRVFADELGARLPSAAERLDRDALDPWCDHLLVRRRDSGAVVGTYRILTAAQAQRAGGFYSEREFELGRLVTLPRLVEVGRACVAPDHRGGAVLALLWAGLAQHFRRHGHEHVIGCASVPARHDPEAAADLCARLLSDHAAPHAWHARPRRPFTARPAGLPARVPAAIRGYLHMGASVCGAPAWDADFGTADLVLLLSMGRMNARFADRLRRAA